MIAPKNNSLFVQEDTPISSGKMESNLAENSILSTSITHLFSEVADFQNRDDNLFTDSESLPSEDEIFPTEETETIAENSASVQINSAEPSLSPSSWGFAIEPNPDTWRILIVDDEKDVHEITHLVLDDYVYEGKPVTLFSAYSAQQAKLLLQQESAFAIYF